MHTDLELKVVTLEELHATHGKRSFEDLIAFRAALVLPMDWLQMMVFDLYALALPLFVPDPQVLPPWVVRKEQGRAWNYGELSAAPLRAGIAGLQVSDRFPHMLPFSDARHLEDHDLQPGQGWDAQRAWAWLTDFAQLPHLRHFFSYAELVTALGDTPGLWETSRAMVVEHKRLAIESSLLWRSVLANALVPT
eukprot:gnl/TRDRNA2_/TRDRNA2_166641_c3_seq1.p1 gnl/TRDRNA2_/TRDRNA2_166641_c3~~gnl/TRDRNA2_/TRDRNA2_166641_c3_seq1.p1  ORF type:complete len:202 (+),score=25.05 gnl/TRDRNA2_/TRDRNA2_166641_c3_seq1:30-608(+)